MKFLNRKILDRSITTRELIFILCFFLCLAPFITPPIALLMGLVVAQFVGHPYLHLNHKATNLLLKFSVVGLGFGMNAKVAFQLGKEGLFVFTAMTILGTLLLGYWIGKYLKIESKTSSLISSGTAICGGSAIAAIAPVIKADEKQMSVALGTIFILNAIALFVFPYLGQLLELTDKQFGLWCAVAIHDTSSVVGAASKFSEIALAVATTVKLSRALWIIPLALFYNYVFKNKDVKVKIPYFIGFFVLAMFANTYLEVVQEYSRYITATARVGLTLTLFLIGCGLSKKVLVEVGIKPLIQGLVLWVAVSLSTLFVIKYLL